MGNEAGSLAAADSPALTKAERRAAHFFGSQTWWTPLRVLLVLVTVVFTLTLVRQVPCTSTDWANSDVRYAAMCYSDLPYLYTGRGFVEHGWPYDAEHVERYQAMEYPVGISYFAWFTSELNRLFHTGPPDSQRSQMSPDDWWGTIGINDETNNYFLLSALLLFVALVATTWLLARAIPGRPWLALPFVVSPVLFLTGLVNWDLLALVFVAGAVWSWHRGVTTSARDRWLYSGVLCGVMIGLGTATKLYPLFLLGAVMVLCLRRRWWSTMVLATCAAALSWLLANLPAMLSSMTVWRVFWSFNSERGADLGSVWLVAKDLGFVADASTINTVSWIFFTLACAAIAGVGLTTKKIPRFDQLAFLIVAAFLLVNKVYSPQYVLWLLPLAVLARRNWRDLLIWQAGEAFYFAMVWFYLGGWLEPGAGSGQPAYTAAIVIRLAAEIYLIIRVLGEMYSSRSDDPDPAPGLVEGNRVKSRRRVANAY